MANIFITSDTHFGHANILNFKNLQGAPLRTFADVSQMNEYMVDRWNEVVQPIDKVYHLGDVLVKGGDWSILKRLNGHKRLILGNHDYPNMRLYLPYFEDIYGTRLLDKILMSHIPIHPLGLGKAIANVHGHVHNNVGPDHFGPQYFNVSVEVLDNYKPIAFEELKKLIVKRLKL